MEEGWKHILADAFAQPSFAALRTFLQEEKKTGKSVYPPGSLIFNAFNVTPFDKVKVVILGQDPYHGRGQAHGLCFSVPKGVKPPPSLVNIFKEIQHDLHLRIPRHGDLTYWATQGVFLLNTILTVEANLPASHQGRGWEAFTDTVIQKISEEKKGVVFLLWGRFAQNKAALIDADKHYILKAAHPSPFSAYSGFMGCSHFSQANALLEKQGLPPIDWSLPG
jgi:uracil-DNA glycosylase